jgi:hypothetical protein
MSTEDWTPSSTDSLLAEHNDLRKRLDCAYSERAKCVAALGRMYEDKGYRVVLDLNPDDGARLAGFGIIYIDGPHGQMSWHIAEKDLKLFGGFVFGKMEWDGHSTEEKYARLLTG